MKIVMCCSNGKNGSYLSHNGNKICFVAKGQNESFEGISAHPDDLIPNQQYSWRHIIAEQRENCGLVEAYKLYDNDIYRSLFKKFGNALYIFSAGWGIVRADFKLPMYNITFSSNSNVEKWAVRKKDDVYNDFNHLLSCDASETIVLLSGIDYIMPFYDLTKNLSNLKIVICKSEKAIKQIQCLNNDKFQCKYYSTTTSTNWYYSFAKNLISGEIEI